MPVDASKLRGEIIDETEPENKDVEGLLKEFIKSIKSEAIRENTHEQ